MSLQETFIQNLKYYRKKKKLTQSELTLEIDMGLNYINGVEQGTFFPKPDVIDRIALALDIDAVLLFADPACCGNFHTENTDSLVERITDRLVQKIQTSVHDDIADMIRTIGEK